MFKKIRTWIMAEVPVVISSQHTSWVLVVLVLLNAGSFAIGYFWGKRTGAQEWSTTISRDAFADQIYNSLCLASIANDDDKDGDTNSQDEDDSADNSDTELVAQTGDTEAAPEQGLEVKTQYYAQLAGFSSLRHAEAFVARLNKKQIPVLIKERVSRSSKGRSVTWYQVVTEPYEDQDALNSVVAILKKEEKLHDVRIVQG